MGGLDSRASTSALGLLSLAIGGGASWLYYQDHYAAAIAPLNPDPDPDPRSDGDQIGYWHNQLCRAFADGGYTTVTFSDVISVASQIRPDLAEQLQIFLRATFKMQLIWFFQKNSSMIILRNSMQWKTNLNWRAVI